MGSREAELAPDQPHVAERGLVWIVDDSLLEAEMARRALAPCYDIEIFEDGAILLERLAGRKSPDALVLDWQLPGMSGLEVCRFLRGTRDEIILPVLMLTVHGRTQDIVEALNAGANDYVTKPYDAAELLARVQTMVRTRRLHERAWRAERAYEIEHRRLRESESRLRMVSEVIPQIVWTAGPEGIFDYVNQRWLEHAGVTLDQTRAEGWHAVVHPEDREGAVAAWRRSLATGEGYESQFRLLHAANGEPRWVLGRALPLRDASGAITKWFGTFTDIHERKRAERSLALLARTGTALFQSLDSGCRCEGITRVLVPELADAVGIYLGDHGDPVELTASASSAPIDGAILQDLAFVTRLLPPSPGGGAEPQAVLIADVAAAADRASGPGAAHLEALRVAGITSCVLAPLAVQGHTFGCLALFTVGSRRRYDESDRALAEELGRRTAVAIDNARLFELTQRERARVEAANQAKDEFLAIVSHELRSPLTAILGWTGLLGEGSLSAEERDRAVQIIERNARSQAQLISDLLNISSISSGKLRLQISPIQPVSIVEAGIEAIHPAADAKGVALFPFLDAEVGVIHADPERLQQIVWNLLTNAVKFTPAGGRVEVHLKRAGSEVEISVADTGGGITPEFLPHVFERFRQAEAGVTRQHGGLGLGLAITHHLVELHGGTIQALSPGPGKGATFIVRLPLAPLSAASTEAPRPARGDSRPPSKIPAELEGLRVLVVDDEKDVRELIASMLTSCKAKVRAAAGVEEAMDALRREPADVLVSDIGMPGESGYDLISRIRRLPPEQGGRMPAVAMTGYARMEDRSRALMMGFDMHIAKPIEAAEMLAVVARLAARSRRS